MGVATKFVRGFTFLITSIPLFGRLGEVPSDARKQAMYETLTTTVFASMPFWILPLFGYFLFHPRPAIGDAVQRGEGLIYASALLGPLVYVITKRYGRFNLRIASSNGSATPLSMSFPYGGLFLTITAITCVAAGFAFAITQQAGSHQTDLDLAGAKALSWILISGSTIIFFLVTAYSNMLEDLEKNKADMIVEEQPRQENSFFQSWLGAKS